MKSMSLVYRMAVGSIRLMSPLLATGGSKLARGIAGRRGAHEVLSVWGDALRDPKRPVVWFHAPSVGEGLQAEAVIEAWVARRPELQVVFTFFSPSAEGFARRIGADVAAYLPWDLRGPIRTALDAIRPDVLAFTKTEVWPVLVEEAWRRGIRVAIVGATVPEGARRMRWPARALLRPTWRRLDLACANSVADGPRLEKLGVAACVTHVTGDPGIDSALRRAGTADAGAAYLSPFHADPRPTVVAGSTWASDEAVLLPAVRSIRSAVPRLRLIIAPHEPEPAHVHSLLRRFRDEGSTVATLTEVEEAGTANDIDVVVVDRVGVLAHLYSLASVSYVGGGFHDAGLHSVLEPAAAGTPIVFGPRHRNARAAEELLASKGAKIASTWAELATEVAHWLLDPDERDRAAANAFNYIERHRGAADRNAERLDALIRGSHS